MKQSNLTKWLATDQRDRIVLIVITLAAFLLRVWRLESTPPGWRDDELINSLVISQKALDGQWSAFYPDASGHEALYHLLNAAMLTLFGPGAAGIRLLSAILGTLTVPLTYLVADRLFGKRVAVLAAAGLAFSFWSLMYSRIGIRHISLPVFMLGAFFYFLRGLGIKWRSVDRGRLNQSGNGNHRLTDFSSAGIFLGIGFYTYFASRGLPLLMLVFCIYIWLFHRPMLKGRVRGLLLMLSLAALIATPLIYTLAQQPESETRVEELAIPLVEARAGNFAPLGEHISGTLNMFHISGDGEWLYNIPGRPVFGPVGAVFFWLGVFTALFYSSKPMLRKMIHAAGRSTVPRWLARTTHLEVASAFTLIWWLGGLSPGFVSVPPASLGHTIIAQSVTYVLMGYPLLIADRIGKRLSIHPNTNQGRRLMISILGLTILISVAWRDLPAYFREWPSRGMTRFLYRAEIKELSQYLNRHPELVDIGVTGLLAGPWDKLALDIDLSQSSAVLPRWYNPERVVLLQLAGKQAATFSGYPNVLLLYESHYEVIDNSVDGAYILAQIKVTESENGQPTCFNNGLCLQAVEYDIQGKTLDLTWQVEKPLELPPSPLVSNPPPPGVYAGPRLAVFVQMIGDDGQIVVSDDGLWVDPATLKRGDRFLQQHRLATPAGEFVEQIIFGLYDPKTGLRILTEDGRDHLSIVTGDRTMSP